MRILWCTVDRSHRVAQQFDIFRSHVKQVADVVDLVKYPAGDNGQNMWQLSHKLINGNIKTNNIVLDYLKEDSNFDFIFCDAFFAYTEESWQSISIPVGILIEDIHHEVPKKQIAIAKSKGIKNIFHRFNFSFHKLHPNARRDFKCFWLPHSVNINKFKDLNNKRYGVLHVGVLPKLYYPYRANSVEQLNSKSYFKFIRRPKEDGNRSNKWPIDEEYIEVINKAKICITGGSIFNAPVQKYIEIPAVKTLLMSNWFADLGLLGFRDGYNMVAYNKENLVKRVEGLLKDKNMLNGIATNGLKLIHEKHTSIIRAEQFINNICQIIGEDLEYPKTKPCSFQVNFTYSELAYVDNLNIKYNKVNYFNSNKEKELPKSKPKQTKPHKVAGTGWRSRIK